jgi:hypothetical protein
MFSEGGGVSGTVTQADIDGDNGLLGCVDGTWTSPQINDASGCAPQGEQYIDSTSQERTAVRSGWLALRTLWEVLDGIGRTGVGIALSAAG